MQGYDQNGLIWVMCHGYLAMKHVWVVFGWSAGDMVSCESPDFQMQQR